MKIRKQYQESLSRIKNRELSCNRSGLQVTLDSLVIEGEGPLSSNRDENNQLTDVVLEDELLGNLDPAVDAGIKPFVRNRFLDDEDVSFESSKINTVTFSKAIFLNGTIIHYSDQPCCLQLIDEEGIDSISCDDCDSYSPSDCPFIDDDCLFEDVRSVFRNIEKFQSLQASRSIRVARIIYKELVAHGRPLHYSLIARIMKGRYPNLNLTDQEVYEFMLQYPEMIERVGEGIYQAKRG